MRYRSLLLATGVLFALATSPSGAFECVLAKTAGELVRGGAQAPLARYRVQPWETLKLADFASSYRTLTRNLQQEWIKELSAGAFNRVIDVKGRKLVLVDACKPTVCDSESILVLFDPTSRAVAYRLREGGLTTTAGEPSLRALAADGCLEGIGE